MDPRIRIRIHPKMSWISNTGCRTGPPAHVAWRAGTTTLCQRPPSQGHGSVDPDPDPPQNVMDPQH